MLIHYFLTGLKPLVLYQPPPINRADFLIRLKDCLDQPIIGDIALLEGARAAAKQNEQVRRAYWDSLIAHAHSPFLKDWAQKMLLMYEELASMLNGQPGPSSFGFFRQALADNDPLIFEKAQAEYMFHLLDESINLDSFAYDQVIAYFIKLEICERFAWFNQEQGEVMLDRLIKSVREVSHDN